MAVVPIFGALSMDIPDAWENRSVLTFVAPEPQAPKLGATVHRPVRFRPNVVITHERPAPASLPSTAPSD